MIDNQSDGGAWRREMLAKPLTVTQLRDMVSELEHCLSIERRKVHELQAQLTSTKMEMPLSVHQG